MGHCSAEPDEEREHTDVPAALLQHDDIRVDDRTAAVDTTGKLPPGVDAGGHRQQAAFRPEPSTR